MSLLKSTIKRQIAEGSYQARIKDFAEVAGDKDDYIVVTLVIKDTVQDIIREERDCIFPARLEYISQALQNQFDRDFKDLEELLNFAKEHDFSVTAKKSTTYGIQYNYR